MAAAGLCMAVMALPELGHGRAVDFRALYAATCLLWVVPMAAAQRWLRRSGVSWWLAIPALLALSYAMSLANNALGELLAIRIGALPRFQSIGSAETNAHTNHVRRNSPGRGNAWRGAPAHAAGPGW